MQVKLNVSYYYIPHLDKAHYGIESGYYKIEIRYIHNDNTYSKKFYMPLHLSEEAIKLCTSLFHDPFMSFAPLSFISCAHSKEKEYASDLIPYPNFGAELMMNVEFNMHYCNLDKEYRTKLKYYYSDEMNELHNTVNNFYDKNDIDVSSYKEKVILHMFRYLGYKNLYNLAKDDTFSFNKVYI